MLYFVKIYRFAIVGRRFLEGCCCGRWGRRNVFLHLLKLFLQILGPLSLCLSLIKGFL